MTGHRDRFIEACITGDKVMPRMSLRPLGAAMRDPATLHRIVDLDHVHPLAQARFLANWTRVCAWQRIRAKIADDDLWFSALRKLLPEYAGTSHALVPALGRGFHLDRHPIMLYRGQPQNEPLGMSWTRSPNIAENFSQWETVLARGQGPGVVFYAKLSAEIICAPCLLGHDEGEYIIDPRGVVAGYYDPWDDDPRA